MSVSQQKLWDMFWDHVADLEEFTVQDVVVTTKYSAATVRKAISAWVEAGRVVQVSQPTSGGRQGSSGQSARYARTDRVVVPKTHPVEHNMWRSMRILKVFDPVDLACHSTTPDVDVTAERTSSYCRMLVRCGYLRVIERASPGIRHARYRLVQDTGPKPPIPRRVEMLHDQNTDALINPKGGAA